MPIGRAYITEDSRGLRIDRYALKCLTNLFCFRIQAQDEGEYVCSAKVRASLLPPTDNALF